MGYNGVLQLKPKRPGLGEYSLEKRHLFDFFGDRKVGFFKSKNDTYGVLRPLEQF